VPPLIITHDPLCPSRTLELISPHGFHLVPKFHSRSESICPFPPDAFFVFFSSIMVQTSQPFSCLSYPMLVHPMYTLKAAMSSNLHFTGYHQPYRDSLMWLLCRIGKSDNTFVLDHCVCREIVESEPSCGRLRRKVGGPFLTGDSQGCGELLCLD